MQEAEITCLTRMVRLPDLELELFKGDVTVISESAAKGSSDLEMMRGLNAVKVAWVRRYNHMRVVVPPPSAVRRPPQERHRTQPVQVAPTRRTVEEPPVRQAAPPKVDLELLADKLAARLGGKFDQILEAVQERPVVVAVPQGQSGQPSAAVAGTVDDEMPMFLPSAIVDHDAKTDIQTKQSTGKASGVDAATAALKKARQRRKTQENE